MLGMGKNITVVIHLSSTFLATGFMISAPHVKHFEPR
jgi:hypothetical protein